jgi:chemotaxis protein methyltransferase CheR
VTPHDYDYVRKLLQQRSGLVLSAEKQYLVESRLLPLARKTTKGSLSELVQKLKSSGAEPLIAEVVDAMTTNETFFFRDKIPFDHFRDTIVPALIDARAAQKHIRIWCAACSTGQEPYSLAIALREMHGIRDWRIEIVATDIARHVIERARAGLYSHFEVQRGLPISLLLKYFTQVGENWQIDPAIRAMVKFRQLNLLRDFSAFGTFDIVFCRNVLIYFDQRNKIDVLRRIAPSMAQDGFLVLGAAETVIGLTDAFRPVADRRGLYAPNPDASLPRISNVIPLVPRIASGASR